MSTRQSPPRKSLTVGDGDNRTGGGKVVRLKNFSSMKRICGMAQPSDSVIFFHILRVVNLESRKVRFHSVVMNLQGRKADNNNCISLSAGDLQ